MEKFWGYILGNYEVCFEKVPVREGCSAGYFLIKIGAFQKLLERRIVLRIDFFEVRGVLSD